MPLHLHYFMFIKFTFFKGSEKQTKTRATGQVLKEATRIGLSLNGLSHVTYALTDPKCKHIPYRDSKVTRILRDSLGGNSKTLMVIIVRKTHWFIHPPSHEIQSTIPWNCINRTFTIKNTIMYY